MQGQKRRQEQLDAIGLANHNGYNSRVLACYAAAMFRADEEILDTAFREGWICARATKDIVHVGARCHIDERVAAAATGA